MSATYYTEESDSEDDRFPQGKKFMSVEIPLDFDPKSIPTNGMEYLQHVVVEARSKDVVVTADIDLNKYHKYQTFCIQENHDFMKLPRENLPSQESIKKHIDDFRQFRDYIQSQLPDSDSRMCGLKKHGLGELTFEKISELSFFGLRCLLDSFVEKVRGVQPGDTISESLQRCLFAVLCVLDTTIAGDVVFMLRDLSRQISVIRWNLVNSAKDADSVKEDVFKLHLFISIISEIFMQRDLSDNFAC